MHFQNGFIYHVYNQGNNHQKIFFSRENYLYFLRKIKLYVLPFADILAWCLMPNHFHLMIAANNIEILPEQDHANLQQVSLSRNRLAYKSLNQSIGIMLRSYTRAINNQQNRSGALFREETKALCLNANNKITNAWYVSQGIVNINRVISEQEYPTVCYNYILYNPVKDGLVTHPEEWEFSSCRDIKGIRHGTLINREKINELGLKMIDNDNN